MADPLSTAIGLITSTIQLERQIQGAIERYYGAPEAAQSIKVFGLGFNATRLHYIEQLLKAQRHNRQLRTEAIPDLEQGARALHKQLRDFKAYFEQREPTKPLPRVWWALRAESKLKRLQQDLQERLNNVAGLLQLVSTASRETSEPLEALTSPIFQPRKGAESEVLEGLGLSKAHYRPHDAQFVENYNPTVHVLIERYPKDVGWGSNNEQQTAQHLREISDSKSNTLGSYHNGLLPCIGYTDDKHGAQRLISLLPRNMSVTEPPRSLRQVILDTKDPNASLTVTLEARFHMALQLARALLAIHTAGFSNCSIRSDKILFVLPLQCGEEEVRETQAPEQRDAPKTNVPVAAAAEFQKPKSGIRRVFTPRYVPGAKDKPGNNVLGAAAGRSEKLVQKFTAVFSPNSKDKPGNKSENYNDKEDKQGPMKRSNSRRSFKGGNVKPAGKEVPPPAHKPLPDNSVLETGAVPPGGGVFLACWRNIREHTAGPPDIGKEWHKDLYRHPLVQGVKDTYFLTGHEVYALGVCLLEIGLWDALIWEDESGLFHTPEILGERLRTLAKELELHSQEAGSKIREKSKVAKESEPHSRKDGSKIREKSQSRKEPERRSQEAESKIREESKVTKEPERHSRKDGSRIREKSKVRKEKSGSEILKKLMEKPEGSEGVRQVLIEIATRELPKSMGMGYTKVVEACLRCMDADINKKYWNVDFREDKKGKEHLALREQFCNAIDMVLVSMLSDLYVNISSEGF